MSFIADVIGEVVVATLFNGLVWLFQTIGLLWIKLFRLDGRSLKTLRKDYKEQYLPHWLGFLTLVGVIVFWWAFL